MKFFDNKKEKLNRLEGKLYSRNAPNIIDNGRSKLDQTNSRSFAESEPINENWQSAKNSSFDELAARVSRVAEKKHTFVKKIFIFSILFFVVASAVAAFVFFGGVNMVSSKNVDIKVVGPVLIGGGQEVSLDVNVVNNNNTDLEAASLLVEYPIGTRSSADLSKELSQERYTLGKIKSGESFNQNVKAVFFGEKDSLKQTKISLEYRVANSSALFYKEKIHEMSISSAPIIITPTYPKEVNSNQEISFNIELASNSKDKINNFLVNVEYPFGFVFKSASPSASFGNNTWQFSNLDSGDKKNILIKGNIIGQDNEERVFKISAGTASDKDERIIAIPFSQLTESVLVKKPFVGLNVSVGGKEGDLAARGGSQVNTELTIKNNLTSKLFNVRILLLIPLWIDSFN
jgi:hypothetical protein